MTLADRIVVMRDGVVQQVGTPDGDLRAAAQPVRRLLPRQPADQLPGGHAGRRGGSPGVPPRRLRARAVPGGEPRDAGRRRPRRGAGRAARGRGRAGRRTRRPRSAPGSSRSCRSAPTEYLGVRDRGRRLLLPGRQGSPAPGRRARRRSTSTPAACTCSTRGPARRCSRREGAGHEARAVCLPSCGRPGRGLRRCWIGTATMRRLLAGGQSLVPMLNLRIARFGHLVDINPLGDLAFVRAADGAIEVGALTRHAALERSEPVRRACPILAAAAHRSATSRSASAARSAAASRSPTRRPSCRRSRPCSMRSWSSPRRKDAGRSARGSSSSPMLTTALEPNEVLIAGALSGASAGEGFGLRALSRRAGDFAHRHRRRDGAARRSAPHRAGPPGARRGGPDALGAERPRARAGGGDARSRLARGGGRGRRGRGRAARRSARVRRAIDASWSGRSWRGRLRDALARTEAEAE